MVRVRQRQTETGRLGSRQTEKDRQRETERETERQTEASTSADRQKDRRRPFGILPRRKDTFVVRVFFVSGCFRIGGGGGGGWGWVLG